MRKILFLFLAFLYSEVVYSQLGTDRTLGITAGSTSWTDSVLLRINFQSEAPYLSDSAVESTNNSEPTIGYFVVESEVVVNHTTGDVDLYDIKITPLSYRSEGDSDDPPGGYFEANALVVTAQRDTSVNMAGRYKLTLIEVGGEGAGFVVDDSPLAISLAWLMKMKAINFGYSHSTDGVTDYDLLGAIIHPGAELGATLGLHAFDNNVALRITPYRVEMSGFMTTGDGNLDVINEVSLNFFDRVNVFGRKYKRTYGFNSNFVDIPADSEFNGGGDNNHEFLTSRRYDFGISVKLGRKRQNH